MKNKKIVIIICIIIVLVCGITGIVLFNKKDKEKVDEFTVISTVKLPVENDNRIYPLEMNFYDEYIGGCFKTEDGKCVNLYANHYLDGSYSEEYKYSLSEYEDASEKTYLGTYKCETYSCESFTSYYSKGIAIIYDDEVVIYNFKTDEKIKTGIKFESTDKNNIGAEVEKHYVSLLSDSKDKGIVLDVTNTKLHKNKVYSVKEKKYLFDDEYSFVSNSGLDDKTIFILNDNVENKTYIVDYDKVVYELKDSYSCSSEKGIDNYLVCIEQDDERAIIIGLDSYKELKKINNVSSYTVINNKIVFSSSYNSNYKKQKIFIYNKENLSLDKEIGTVSSLEELKVDKDIYYVGSVDLGRGGEYYETVILDSELNVILDLNMLEKNYTSINDVLFKVTDNKDNTLLIETAKKSYVFDLETKKIK